MALILNVVTTSTRPGRKGPAIADWFVSHAKAHGGFEVVPVDLAEIGLPLFDEPEHPMRRKYQHEHTKRWSAITQKADAFVFVTPEYNYFPAPSLVNAIDYLHGEWQYKPAGFVSYGGVSGGMRAVQVAKGHLATVKMMPIPEGVVIPGFFEHLKDGVFQANEIHRNSATAMLDEMKKWAEALRPLHRPAAG